MATLCFLSAGTPPLMQYIVRTYDAQNLTDIVHTVTQYTKIRSRVTQ